MAFHIILEYFISVDQGIVPDHSVIAVLNVLSDLIVSQFLLLVSFQFISSVACVATRLTILIQNIKELLPLNEGEVREVQLNGAKEAFVLRNIALLHDKLLDAVDEINEVFSKEMIALFLLSTAIEVLVSYFVVKVSMLEILPIVKTWILINLMIWSVLLVLPCIISIYISDKATNESRRLLNHVERYSSSYRDESALLKLDFLLNKLRCQPIILSCGMFNINWSFALSMSGAIITYIIILTQFENNV
ncbi:CLUMA_CG016160, isoform A [Clunio marinus]|uniref:CLUMA_CG016160, isoform A n=1 Tax=Clunio marinus TaxID=568069 RepID=A0A1J1IT59_9DIPT|nr:CLUMA_CG016160, isoform A [Clunio marinus]